MPGFGDAQQERVVAVVGRTGCGKSTFARAMMLGGNLSREHVKAAASNGLVLPDISNSLASCTKAPALYSIPPIEGVEYKVMDMMGLQDTDEQDQEHVEQMAMVLPHLPSLVGIVYVVSGRMDPSEAENCHFLFNEFFAEVTPGDMIVVRSKCEDWDVFDVRKEKEYLRGKVPDTVLNAEWVPVDFSRNTPAEDGNALVQQIRDVLARWTRPLQLSDKYQIACDYVPMCERLEMSREELAAKERGLKDLSRQMLELQSARAIDAQDAVAKQKKIQLLQDAMAAAEDERCQMYERYREKEAESRRIYQQLSSQMESLKQQANDARAEKHHREQELLILQKEGDEKSSAMIEKIAMLSDKLKTIADDGNKFREEIRREQEATRKDLMEFKAQHERQISDLQSKINRESPIARMFNLVGSAVMHFLDKFPRRRCIGS